MTEGQWQAFCKFRDEFKSKVNEWMNYADELQPLQKKVAVQDKVPDYSFELPVVYNSKLDEITCNDDIRLIVIGDNPGKDEQLKKNSSYLVGQAGKIAEGYFKRNSELNIDFRKNVIILNKTPIHSAKTNQLKRMAKDGGQKIADLIQESQEWMAEKTAWLLAHMNQDGNEKTRLWLVGYAELKDKGIFVRYKEVLKRECLFYGSEVWNQVFVYQHFSMNRFSIDLRERIEDGTVKSSGLENQILELGTIHRDEIFGC